MLELPTYKTKERVKNEPPANVDIAIVGAGLGGLTAGAFLARNGWRVACFDPHYVAGGCTTQFSRGSGDHAYFFDVGLHYIGDCGAEGKIPTLLRSLGIDLTFAQMDPDGFDIFTFPDFTFRIPSNHELYRQRLLDLFPEEKKGIDAYLKFLLQLNGVMEKTDRSMGKITPSVALHTLLKGWKVIRYQGSTLKDVLDQCTQNPKLRAVLSAQHGIHGSPPSQVSALLHGGATNHYLRGAYYPKGGGQIISNQIAETIEANGGSIHLHREVTKIMIEKDRAVGVMTRSHRGEEHEVRAKVVLSGADLIQTCKHLIEPEHLPSSWQKKLRSWTMGKALFTMYLGVKTDLREHGMRNANYWKFEDYDVEKMYRDMERKDLVIPNNSYTTSASLKEISATKKETSAIKKETSAIKKETSAIKKETSAIKYGPEGHQTLEVMSLVSGLSEHWGVPSDDVASGAYRRKESYLELKQQVEEKLLTHLEQQFPGVRETITFSESASPVTHTRYTRATSGTSYGLASTPEQLMLNRPGYATPIKGLYICGASSRAGHGIVGVMSSGHESAHEISKMFKRPIPAIY